MYNVHHTWWTLTENVKQLLKWKAALFRATATDNKVINKQNTITIASVYSLQILDICHTEIRPSITQSIKSSLLHYSHQICTHTDLYQLFSLIFYRQTWLISRNIMIWLLIWWESVYQNDWCYIMSVVPPMLTSSWPKFQFWCWWSADDFRVFPAHSQGIHQRFLTWQLTVL